jgi:hypothetical protein
MRSFLGTGLGCSAEKVAVPASVTSTCCSFKVPCGENSATQTTEPPCCRIAPTVVLLICPCGTAAAAASRIGPTVAENVVPKAGIGRVPPRTTTKSSGTTVLGSAPCWTAWVRSVPDGCGKIVIDHKILLLVGIVHSSFYYRQTIISPLEKVLNRCASRCRRGDLPA